MKSAIEPIETLFMKSSVYVDTSVLLPVYVPEPLSHTAAERLAEAGEICISRLAEVEFYSALARKLRMREIDTEQARRIVDTFARHLHSGLYTTLRVSNDVFDLSRDYLKKFSSNLCTLDALPLACCANAKLTLITADKTLDECARQFDVASELLV